MTNHKRWSMSSAPVRQLLEMRDTPEGSRVFEELVRFIKSYMKSEPTISTQKFILERGRIYAGSKQTIKHRAVPGQNLGSGEDWELSADLPGWHNDYPKTISSKGLRPDIVLSSMTNLKIIVVELSIPYESRMDLSPEYKTSKYEDLKKTWKRKGTA